MIDIPDISRQAYVAANDQQKKVIENTFKALRIAEQCIFSARATTKAQAIADYFQLEAMAATPAAQFLPSNFQLPEA